jgi:UDP-N-acetylmuramoyl-L-alanyl-D-glutamate--2,6-diaminopimelate ligase
MKLSELLQGVPWRRAGQDGDPEIAGLCFDSRRAGKGDLFVAVKGLRQDGHAHAPQAVLAGASAVLAETPLDVHAPVAVVPSVQALVSPLSARFYNYPSRGMSVIGVTGTNGKTTITHMLEHILRRAGASPGVMGTIAYRWAGKEETAPNTTPMAGDVQRLMDAMRRDGVTHVAMEVSSHALSLGRVEDVAFSVAVFTNLTRDHLDFHKDMESYFEAKARLFELLERSPAPRGAVINSDDPWADKFAARVHGKMWTYGLDRTSDVTARDLSLTAQGSAFTLLSPKGSLPFRMPLVGRHNVYNALAATSAAALLDVPLETIQSALAEMPGVAGRLERVFTPASEGLFGVFVDYAHTDDALKNVMSALRPLTQGRLITVFGCGGDRDRSKRPLMGEAAVAMSDHVIITSDNPRSEEPAKIAVDIEMGARRAEGGTFEVVLDREEAINRAVRMAEPGDVVLLAGKGHETYQIFKDRTVDFDDRSVARGILRSMLG